MSFAFAACSAAVSLHSARASASSAAFFAAVDAAAILLLAARAAAPMWAIVAWRSVEVMGAIVPKRTQRSLPPVLRREARRRELVRVDIEADHRRGAVRRHVELVGLQRIDGEDVAVRL